MLLKHCQAAFVVGREKSDKKNLIKSSSSRDNPIKENYSLKRLN